MLLRFKDTLDIGNSVFLAVGYDPHAFPSARAPQHFERPVSFEFEQQPTVANQSTISAFGIFLAHGNGSLMPITSRLGDKYA